MSPSTDLKLISILLILISSAAGVSTPLLLRRNLPFAGAAKAFAAGVILATGFVHILPDATESLADPSLSGTVWVDFPFAGFVAMIAALGTLVVDFVGIMVYQRKGKGKLEDGMHIVGVRAHVGEEHGIKEVENGGGDNSNTRHIVVSQILELGIVSHSVIVGLSLGVSQKTSTIRPLVAALSFHQFFEGFALGGCISQADFKNLKQILMACFFAITTPGGIAMGLATSSFYDSESPIAIVVQGVLNSVSAAILIYMALVDLIATDFLDQQKTSSMSHQVSSYVALFLGAGLMSLLAIWASSQLLCCTLPRCWLNVSVFGVVLDVNLLEICGNLLDILPYFGDFEFQVIK